MSRSRFRSGVAPIVLGLALIASPAFAQDEAAPQEAEEEAPAGDIIVTGSRIANPNLTSTSPLTTVSQEEFKFQGTTRVEDLVNNLPQAFAGQGGQVSNGSTGTATVNLRNLGSVRTLVLINGRRLVPGDPRSPVADLNSIPASLVERVDVLTGGASSVYGSDAVAGVVNFIMDNDFEGFRLDSQYSLYQHNNDGDPRVRNALAARNFPTPTGNTVTGGQFDATLTFGAGFDDGRGHVTAYAGYRKINPILQAEYDYSACSVAASTATNTFSCAGSGTTAPAQFQFFRASDFSASSAVTLDPATSGANTAFRPYSAARDAFNFAPTNYYQRPDERFTLGAFAEYEVSESFKPYLEVSFMDDRTVAQIAPSGAFGVQFTVDCVNGNALFTAAQLATACNAARTVEIPDNPATTGVNEFDPAQTTVEAFVLRRNVEGGGRQDDLRHTNYRIVAGAKGNITENFTYDVYGQYGRTIFNQIYRNDFSVTRLGRALDLVNRNGQVVCRSVVDGTDPNCVPYQVAQSGGVTPAALAYLQTPGFSNGQVTEQILSGSISGDLGTLPWSEDAVGIAVGAEYRKEALLFETDLAFSTGDLAGQGGPTIGLSGGFDVKEIFGELRVPLVTDKPFFHELAIDGGYRYSDYSSAGSTDTYKIGAEWSPIEDIRLRGSYNRAVRAPNVVELFSAQAIGLFEGTDPCAGIGANAPLFTLAQCQLTGVTAAQYGTITPNSAGQYNQFSGGNPNLDPEISDTYTFGVVVAPTGGFLKGFSLSVDYFDIKVDNTISTVGAQLILNQCGLTGNATLCSLIQRGPGGSLWLSSAGFVRNTNVNIGSLTTKGIDIAADYRLDLDDVGINNAGRINFSFVGTYLDKLVTEPGVVDPSGATTYECTGFYGVTCGVPSPEWRSKLRATYLSPGGVSVSVNWRYIGSTDSEQVSGNSFLDASPTDVIAGIKIKSYSYFDLATSVDIADILTLRVGVNNIFDKDPPVIGSGQLSATFGNGNTYPGVYDALGRYLYAGATLKF